MNRGVVVIGVAWMVVMGTFDNSNAAWKRMAIELPSLAPEKKVQMIGGWTW